MKQLFLSLLVWVSALIVSAQNTQENRDLKFDIADLQIIEKAHVLLSEPSVWNKQDDRICEDDVAHGKYSLYCALYKASIDINEEYVHRRAALQQVRFTLEKYENGRIANHGMAFRSSRSCW